MLNKLKVRAAARRVNQNHRRNRTANTRNRRVATRRTGFWGRVWNLICAPFRFLGRVIARIWAWIRGIDLVGLLNLTLLVAIVVLFSMLVIDIIKARRSPVVVIAEPVPVVTDADIARKRAATRPTLPIRRDARTNKFESEPVSVVPVKKEPVVERQIAKSDNTMYGDVIIDSRAAGAVLTRGARVKGNLYIQRMHKYILPCDMYIDGHLFLRDMGVLQFCGDFTVTGNIYVSPRSSFGPIPKTARIGGQVIL